MNRVEIPYLSYQIEELPEGLRSLIKAAAEAATTAYAPYSGFNVGVAARLSDGSTIYASNQESASFPAGLCAERVLLFSHFNSEKSKTAKIDLMVISAYKQGHETDASPCGICRQSLVEAEERQGQDIALIFLNEGKYTVITSAKILLPFSFNAL